MMPHDRHDRVRKVNRRQDVCTDACVQLHLLELGLSQFSGFVEDVLRNGQLAHVMKKCRSFDCFQQLFVAHTDVSRKARRVYLDTANMAVGDLIFCVNRHREGLDR